MQQQKIGLLYQNFYLKTEPENIYEHCMVEKEVAWITFVSSEPLFDRHARRIAATPGPLKIEPTKVTGDIEYFTNHV